MLRNYPPTAINAAIARGDRVTARHADLERKRQPARGAEVVVTEAFSQEYDGRVRVTAEGYRGRFAVTDVLINGLSVAASIG